MDIVSGPSADSGDEVANVGIVIGYVRDKDTFIEVWKEEFESNSARVARTKNL